MATDNVIEEILDIAEDRWNEGPEELYLWLGASMRAWWTLIVSVQRLRLVKILGRLHVPPRVAIFLVGAWPTRLLPALPAEREQIDDKTLPGCPRTG